MGTTRLDGFLKRHRRIALDTSFVICAVEANPKYLEFVSGILNWIEAGGNAVTSTIAMTEALVRPYRLKNIEAVDKFYTFLLTYPQVECVAPTLKIADRAAPIRATHNLRTPDAIQAATAITTGATGGFEPCCFFAR